MVVTTASPADSGEGGEGGSYENGSPSTLDAATNNDSFGSGGGSGSGISSAGEDGGGGGSGRSDAVAVGATVDTSTVTVHPSEPLSVLCTAGCPAAGALGFKGGGIRQIKVVHFFDTYMYILVLLYILYIF